MDKEQRIKVHTAHGAEVTVEIDPDGDLEFGFSGYLYVRADDLPALRDFLVENVKG